MKNFHLPLPEQTWSGLRAEAERAQVPATALAREAIDFWLREQAKKARHDQIAAWAAGVAGTDLDLDPGLEAAGIDHLVPGKRPAARSTGPTLFRGREPNRRGASRNRGFARRLQPDAGMEIDHRSTGVDVRITGQVGADGR